MAQMKNYRLLPGFRAIRSDPAEHDHWQGGEALHRGAECLDCKRPLLLLWDINVHDPRFVGGGRRVFPGLKRLPLYYCWKCAAEIDYQVGSNDRVKTVKRSYGQPPQADFPYPNYPEAFARHPLRLDPVSEIIDAIESLEFRSLADTVPRSLRPALETWTGRPIRYVFDIWWSQFGGIPGLTQGLERILCPNVDCPRSASRLPMRVLASIRNDPPNGLPMIESEEDVQKSNGRFNSCVEVVFYVCRTCWTIHAGNRCD